MHVLITGANGFVGQATGKPLSCHSCVGGSRSRVLTLTRRQFDDAVVD